MASIALCVPSAVAIVSCLIFFVRQSPATKIPDSLVVVSVERKYPSELHSMTFENDSVAAVWPIEINIQSREMVRGLPFSRISMPVKPFSS